MSSNRVQDVVERFVAELVEAAELDAADAMQDRLRGVLGGQLVSDGQGLVKRRKTTKGYTVLRPCPIAGCKETAAPRYGMVCKGHSQALTREEILIARDNAIKPDGIWFGLVRGRKVS